MTYDDLLPGAIALLKSRRLREAVARRWPLVICDEFQDTNEQQWRLLKVLGTEARLLLLGDVNQMIYTFLKEQGVGPERLEHAQRLADRVIKLEIHSHRDPSGAIPATADAVRRRDFTHEAIVHTVRSGQLQVLADVNSEEDEALAEVISTQVSRLRTEGARSIGIFAHSNQGVATLSAALAQSGLDHVLIGLPEAHAEALSALAMLCARGVGLVTEEEVRSSLATFLTACTRGRSAPELARKLAHGLSLPLTLEQRLRALDRALQDAAEGTMAGLVNVACQGWEAIGITSGVRPWRQAGFDFVTLARRLTSLPASQDSVRSLMATTERRKPSALVEFDSPQVAPIQLMNFYQTKGREADAILLVYRTGDYLADYSNDEPYEELSRVLFVSLTRARQQVVVIMPPDPHPLIALLGSGVTRVHSFIWILLTEEYYTLLSLDRTYRLKKVLSNLAAHLRSLFLPNSRQVPLNQRYIRRKSGSITYLHKRSITFRQHTVWRDGVNDLPPIRAVDHRWVD